MSMLTRLLTAALAFSATTALAEPADPADPNLPRLKKVLAATPLIDGHNDWPGAIAGHDGDARWSVDLTRLNTEDFDTDITRLRQGMVGGQFWSVYVPATLPPLEQVKKTLEQIDLVKSIVRRYPAEFTLARTAAQVRAAHKAGRIASLIGAEGGGQIDESFSVLRAYAELGVGYLTLTHSRTIAWADSATDDPAHGGLTPFGVAVVREMNRLNMLVDLSHVNEDTMLDAIAASRAPVIFSHSSARALCDHPRNVSDKVLKEVARTGGIVMVAFAPNYISEARRVWGVQQGAQRALYNQPPLNGLYIGQPDRAKAAMEAWLAANPEPHVTVQMVADHIDHIAKVAGYDHVGLGGDYDGLPALPDGMTGVESYPPLLLELMKRGWSDANIAKLAGGNILRVMEQAEKVAASLRDEPPATGTREAMDAAPKS
ncbi:membrane dipeptidase [Sphingobium sp. B2D3A]|uniref:dipeptidase n=1 Tax=unclassified Sphingobium TaxID=2611147 RepID=UPI0022245F0C|nr:MULTISPECIES: dipeptidase [unclassified Sphingobium]MCW2336277.1 membrane dipeptidase [Sphingobium sp. B2D3A]MCW2386032.1 membrane dipeptidase [Sphingobium sp. B2D3D]